MEKGSETKSTQAKAERSQRLITNLKQTRQLVDPFPITMSKGRYRWTVSTVAKLAKLKCFWDRRARISSVARSIGKRWPARHHHISALIQSGPEKMPVIMVEEGVIIDGNHRLIAMVLMKFKGPVIKVEWIRRSGRGNESVKEVRKLWKKKRKAKWA